MSRLVMRAVAIKDVALQKKNPPTLYVLAQGEVSSTGWNRARLEPRVYVTPPADGVQEFDFVAEPPDGIRLPVITPVLGEGCCPAADWLQGVRVYAETNTLERPVAPDATALVDVDLDDPESGPSQGDAAAADPMDDTLRRVADTAPEDVESDELVEMHTDAGFRAGSSCLSFTVFSVSGWPETKTVWKNKCIVKIGGKCRLKTNVPVVYTRKSKLRVIASICLKDADELKREIEDCVKQAIAAGVFAGVLTGNLGAIAAAFTAHLKGCLAAKSVDVADLSVRLRQHKKPGKWKKL